MISSQADLAVRWQFFLILNWDAVSLTYGVEQKLKVNKETRFCALQLKCSSGSISN